MNPTRKTLFSIITASMLATSCMTLKNRIEEYRQTVDVPYTQGIDSTVTKDLRAIITYMHLTPFARKGLSINSLEDIYHHLPLALFDDNYDVATFKIDEEVVYIQVFKPGPQNQNNRIAILNKTTKERFLDKGPNGIPLRYDPTGAVRRAYHQTLHTIAQHIEDKAKTYVLEQENMTSIKQ